MAGFGGFGGQNIGQALIRVGADFRGLQAQTAAAMGTMKAQMNAATANLGSATAETQRLNQRLAQTEAQAVKAGKAVKLLAFGLGAIGVGIAAMAVKSAISFESAFAGVEKTVDGTRQELDHLRNSFIELSKEIPVSANELAGIGEAAGALGVPLQNIMKFTETVATMAQTTDVSSDQAATALGQLSNVLKLTGDDYARFASTLVDLGNNGASTESQILQMASRAGGSGKLIGLATESVLAFSSATANLGIRVEAGGSSLQKFFLELNKGVGEGKKNLKIMADITGMTKKGFADLFNRDAEKGILTLLEGLSRLDKVQRQLALGDLGMDDIRITRMLLGMSDNVDMVRAAVKRGHIAWEQNTAAVEEAEKRYKTTAVALSKIKNIIQAGFIALGDEGLDGLKEILNVIVDELPKGIDALATIWREQLAEPFSRLGDAAGELLGIFVGLFDGGATKGEDMGNVLTGLVDVLATFVDLLARAVEMFNALLSNQIVNSLLKVGAIFAGLAIAAKVLGGLKGLFAGIGKGAAMKMGMGRFLPGMQEGKENAMDMKAATTQMAAGELQLKAATMAATGGKMAGFGGLGGKARTGSGLQMLGGGAGRTLPMGYSGFIAPGDHMAMKKMGGSLVKSMGSSIAKGARGAMALGGAALRGGLGLISKAFWPAFIGLMVAEIASAPIGAMLKQTKGWERVGSAFEQDFFTGMFAAIEAFSAGTDAFVNRSPEVFKVGMEGSTGEGSLSSGLIKRLAESPEAVEEVRGIMDEIEEAIEGGTNPAFAQQKLADWAKTAMPTVTSFNEAISGLGEALESGEVEADWALKGMPGEHIRSMKIELQEDGADFIWGLQQYKEAADLLGIEIPREVEGVMDLGSGTAYRRLDEWTDPAFWEQHTSFFEEVDAEFKSVVEAASQSLTIMLMKAMDDAGLEIDKVALQNLTGDTGAQSALFEVMAGQGAELPDFLKQFGASQLTGVRPGEKAPVAGDPSAPFEEQIKSLEEFRGNFGEFVAGQTEIHGESGMSLARAFLLAYDQEFEDTMPLSNRKRLKLLRKMGVIDPDFKPGKKIDKKEEAYIDSQANVAEQQLATAKGITGADQLERGAEGAKGVMKRALAAGLSKEEFNEALGTGFFARLIDGLGEPSDDIKERAGDAFSGAFYSILGKGEKVKGKENKKGANKALNKMLGTLFDFSPEDLKGMKLGEKLDAVAGTMVDEYEGADSPQEKNKLQNKLKKLFPDKIMTWEDVVAKMESPSVEQWDTKWGELAEDAMTNTSTKGDEIITDLLDPIAAGVTEWDPPTGTMTTKVQSLINAATAAVDAGNEAIKPKVDAFLAQLARLAAGEARIPDTEGGGGGDEGEGGDVSGGAGLSFEGNADALGDAGGGADLSFAGNMAGLDGSAMAAAAAPMPDFGGGSGGIGSNDMPSDFGGGLYSQAQGGSGGSEQNIYVQSMNVMGENDEGSVLQQFAFMDPGGGGNA